MAQDNGGGLDAADQTGIVHDAGVDVPAGGPEEIPAAAERVAGSDEDALSFQDEQREVVGNDIAKSYEDQAVEKSPPSRQRAKEAAACPEADWCLLWPLSSRLAAAQCAGVRSAAPKAISIVSKMHSICQRASRPLCVRVGSPTWPRG